MIFNIRILALPHNSVTFCDVTAGIGASFRTQAHTEPWMDRQDVEVEICSYLDIQKGLILQLHNHFNNTNKVPC